MLDQVEGKHPTIVAVAISSNGKDFSANNGEFEYFGEWFVEDLQPVTGPVTGGTLIVISGTNFQQRVGISCLFDGKEEVPACTSKSPEG